MTHDNLSADDLLRDDNGMLIRRGAGAPAPAVPSAFRDTALIEHTSVVISAYVAHNPIPAAGLPELIGSVYAALAGLGGPEVALTAAEPLKPAVPVRKSVTDDYIVCLDDGKRFKSLKRHLAQLGMTSEEYRRKWNLPADYPMVSKNYAARRSELARSIGLGRKAAVVE